MSWNPPEISGWRPGMPIPVTDAFGNVVDWVSESAEDQIVGCLVSILMVIIVIVVGTPIIAIYNGIAYLIRGEIRNALFNFAIPVVMVVLIGGCMTADYVYNYVKDDLLCWQVSMWADPDTNTVYVRSTSGAKHVGVVINRGFEEEFSVYATSLFDIYEHEFEDIELYNVRLRYVWKYGTTTVSSEPHIQYCDTWIMIDGEAVTSGQ